MRRFPSIGPWLWTPAVFLADLASKRLVLQHVEDLRSRIEILGDFFRLAYVRNPGAAMGLFHGGRPFLIAVSAVASVVLLLLYRRTPPEMRLRRGALAAILGGALGNLVDRVFYGGYVVDFLDFGVGASRFYTFNLADAAVTVGGAVLFLSLWFQGKDGEPAEDGAATAPPAPGDGDRAEP